MKIKGFEQITFSDRLHSRKTRNQINKDYPGQAMVRGDCCYITDNHYEYCKDYVQVHCNINKNYLPR